MNCTKDTAALSTRSSLCKSKADCSRFVVVHLCLSFSGFWREESSFYARTYKIEKQGGKKKLFACI